MKKLIVIFALCLGAAMPAFAQNYEDVVHLKNGSIIRGTIVEQVPGESLKIETREGSLFFYSIDEVQKITKELKVVRRDASRSQFNKPRGYFGLPELSVGVGVDDYYVTTRVSATMVNGFRFLPQFAMGLGVGVEEFSYTDDYDTGSYWEEAYAEYTLPVFLHLRSDFINRKVSPYAFLNIGYNFPMESTNYYGGTMTEFGAGVSFNVGRKNRLTFGVSYKADDFNGSHASYYSRYGSTRDVVGSVNLKAGFSF